MRYLALLFCLASTFVQAQIFTLEIPEPQPPSIVSNILVARGEEWHWRRGTNTPQAEWNTIADASLDATWSHAPGGFGYGDNAIVGEATRISGMVNSHSTIYIRKTFTLVEALEDAESLVLTVDYDDGFVAYLDGREVARRNVPGGVGSPVANTATTGGISHEASCCNNPNPAEAIDIGTTTAGAHVLAVIGVNQSKDSSDFHLIVDLARVKVEGTTNSAPLVNKGTYALATESVVTLQGSNSFPVTRVTLNGDEASVDTTNGNWSMTTSLIPGRNQFYIAAHDHAGSIVTNVLLDVIYEAATAQVWGVVQGVVTWNDPSTIIRVTNNLTIPDGSALEIGAGVVVILEPGTSITAVTNGIVRVSGEDEQRALFLPAERTWGWLRALGTNALLDISFGEVVAGQVRVHTGGGLVIEDSIIRDYPDTGIEVIEAVGGGELTMRRCYMTRFAEGDSSETPVLVEGCLLEGFLVDGLDIKATSAPLLVRRSTFRRADPNNLNADAIDFGPGAGTVESCLIHDFPDKGVSIGGAPGTRITDTVIYRCGIGLSAYSSSNLVFLNTTIYDCTTGILFRDNPTRAVGVATNFIVWGNETNIAIQNTSLFDISFSDIQNTNFPGVGNISADPLFLNPAQEDFRLAPNSPAKGTGADGLDMGSSFPVGGIPGQPLSVIALPVGRDVIIRWLDNSENEDQFLIQRSSEGTNWQTIGNVSLNVTEFADRVADNNNFYYRVRATNGIGVSEFSNRAKVSARTPVGVVLRRGAVAGTLELVFRASEGASYTLQARDSLTEGTWETVRSFSNTGTQIITEFLQNEADQRFYRLMTN